MKESFITKRFEPQSRTMIETINEILDDYQRDGYDLSLRQLYYQLVSRNLVPNTERSYKNVGSLVSDGRLAGLIDWAIIKDRGREMVENPHWDDAGEFLRSVAPQFKIDRWMHQTSYVEVMVEKQALEGVLIPVCRELDIPFTANKGYSSSSAMYEAGKRMREKMDGGKHVIVIYLGDHDPSGIDMSRDVEDRLRMFAETSEGDEYTIKVERAALNIDQIRKLKPPENPAKITDSRAKAYIREFGRSSWELDAIEPKKLAALVRTSVMQYIDDEEFERSGEAQQGDIDKLIRFASKFNK
jgi:hypothetical protein